MGSLNLPETEASSTKRFVVLVYDPHQAKSSTHKIRAPWKRDSLHNHQPCRNPLSTFVLVNQHNIYSFSRKNYADSQKRNSTMGSERVKATEGPVHARRISIRTLLALAQNRTAPHPARACLSVSSLVTSPAVIDRAPPLLSGDCLNENSPVRVTARTAFPRFSSPSTASRPVFPVGGLSRSTHRVHRGEAASVSPDCTSVQRRPKSSAYAGYSAVD